MLNIHVFYRAENGEDLQKFYAEAKALGVIEKSRQDEGCLRYDYFFSADRDNEILLLEKWESKELQEKHNELPHVLKLGELKKEYKIRTEFELL